MYPCRQKHALPSPPLLPSPPGTRCKRPTSCLVLVSDLQMARFFEPGDPCQLACKHHLRLAHYRQMRFSRVNTSCFDRVVTDCTESGKRQKEMPICLGCSLTTIGPKNRQPTALPLTNSRVRDCRVQKRYSRPPPNALHARSGLRRSFRLRWLAQLSVKLVKVSSWLRSIRVPGTLGLGTHHTKPFLLAG